VRLSSSDTLEIRRAASTNDKLNILYTLATRARLEARNREARDTMTQLLAIRPASVIGWYETGLGQ